MLTHVKRNWNKITETTKLVLQLFQSRWHIIPCVGKYANSKRVSGCFSHSQTRALVVFLLTLLTPKAVLVLHRIIRSWYTGRWRVNCYLWYSEEGPGRAAAPPSPLLAVPNVTAYPSMASVPTTVLLYDGPLLCSFNVAIKGLSHCCKARASCDDAVYLFVSLSWFVCLSMCWFVCPSRLPRSSRQQGHTMCFVPCENSSPMKFMVAAGLTCGVDKHATLV